MFCGIILHQLKQEVGRTVDDDYNPTESPLDLAETTQKFPFRDFWVACYFFF